MRYFLKLSYLGTAYNGWQRQDNAVSVQETIEKALSLLLSEPVVITGCGRTDTGVHAKCYYTHLDLENELDPQFLYKLNSILPLDIAIQEIFSVSPDLHARFSTISREYKYFIHLKKNPFLTGQSWFLYKKLDLDAMNRACSILMEYNDFASFCKKGADNKTTLCKLYEAKWEEKDHGLIFNIRADRFLRNMVRAIVGTLVDVGTHKTDIHQLRLIIESKGRQYSGTSVPACGLYLSDITYPENSFPF